MTSSRRPARSVPNRDVRRENLPSPPHLYANAMQRRNLLDFLCPSLRGYSRKVRIGVDATCWNQRRGYGRHLRALLRAVYERNHPHEFVLFVDAPPAEEHAPPVGAELRRVYVQTPAATAARAEGSRSLPDMWAMSRALSDPSLDCVFFPTVYSFVPVFTRASKLLMIHDVIAERLPQYVFPTRSGWLKWKAKCALAVRQSRMILTVSDFSRRSIADYFKIPLEKVRVIGEAADAVFRRLPERQWPEALAAKGIRPGGRLITYVGGFSPHKNLLRLLEVFDRLTAEPRLEDVHLVLVGDYSTDPFYSSYPELKRRLDGSRIAARVVFTGFLPDGDLVRLLNHSSLLALPSLMEGFGLPAVEAAACAVPVVATKHSPIPELLGEGAIAVDPHSTEEIHQAIVKVLDDEILRRGMGETAACAAAALSWERAADDLLSAMDEVAAALPLRNRQASRP